MLNKKSLERVKAVQYNVLNYVSNRLDFKAIDELSNEEVDIIHMGAYALQELLELAYINNQLNKISYYNFLYWEQLLDVLKNTNYPKANYELLKAGFKQLLKANGFKDEDIEELLSRH